MRELITLINLSNKIKKFINKNFFLKKILILLRYKIGSSNLLK